MQQKWPLFRFVGTADIRGKQQNDRVGSEVDTRANPSAFSRSASLNGQEPTFGNGHYIRLLCVKLESQDRDIVILCGLTLE
ncbi:MAG: hypothetical protein V3R80_01775, partial [Candidatus Tectomicrobia bacterium]